jgi:hypothetical protein
MTEGGRKVNQRFGVMRTIGVLLVGVIVAFVTDAILRQLLMPDFGSLLVRMHETQPESDQWAAIWSRWHHMNMISLFLLAPLDGLVAGIVVGLFQKYHAPLLAASTQIPSLLALLWFDRLKPSVHSLSGGGIFVAERLLPIIAATLGALLCRRLLALRRSNSDSDGAVPLHV